MISRITYHAISNSLLINTTLLLMKIILFSLPFSKIIAIVHFYSFYIKNKIIAVRSIISMIFALKNWSYSTNYFIVVVIHSHAASSLVHQKARAAAMQAIDLRCPVKASRKKGNYSSFQGRDGDKSWRSESNWNQSCSLHPIDESITKLLFGSTRSVWVLSFISQ